MTTEPCGLTSTVPIDVLLVSLAVDDHLGIRLPDTEVDAATAADPASVVSWTCDSCADLVTAPLDRPTLLTLVTAGASLLDDAPRSPAAAPFRETA